jgi:hypothetical protein
MLLLQPFELAVNFAIFRVLIGNGALNYGSSWNRAMPGLNGSFKPRLLSRPTGHPPPHPMTLVPCHPPASA